MPDLDIFVSWSRPASHQAAQAFNEWLPKALPGVKPWLSSEDITKGTSWFSAISSQLACSGACILCITPENVKSPWLFYEAGAIAFASKGALICPYLIGVEPSEISGTPLGQYQVTRFDPEDTWRLLRDLNGRLASPNHLEMLRSHFEANWPSLQLRIGKVSNEVMSSTLDNLLKIESENSLIDDDADARCLLHGWWGDRTAPQRDKPVSLEDVDRELNLIPGTASRLLVTAVSRYNYVVDTKGPKFIVFRKAPSESDQPVFSNSGRDDPRNPFRRQ